MKTNQIDDRIFELLLEIRNHEGNIKRLSKQTNPSKTLRYIISLLVFTFLAFFNILFIFPALLSLVFVFIKLSKHKKDLRQNENDIKTSQQLIKDANNEIESLRIKKRELYDNQFFDTYVAGTFYRQKELNILIKHLTKNSKMKLNPDYRATKKELEEYGLEGYDIHEYEMAEIELTLVDEPENEFDEDAIAVYFIEDNLNIKLGYIPAKHNKQVKLLNIEKTLGYTSGGKTKSLQIVDYDYERDKTYYRLYEDDRDFKVDLKIVKRLEKSTEQEQ